MDLPGGLFSGSNEGLTGARPKANGEDHVPPKPSLFTYLSVREEELWAGDGRLLSAPPTVHGDGI